MKTTILIIGAVLIVIGSVFLLGSPGVLTISESPTPQPKTTGRVIFEITDTAVALEDISSVIMTVKGLRAHHVTEGWINIIDINANPQNFDLLKLKATGEKAMLADAEIPLGSYDQIHLTVNKVAISEIKSGITMDARLPSEELVINAGLLVDKDLSSVLMDFLVDQSLHRITVAQGFEGYVFAPVLKLNAWRNARIGETGGPIDGTPYIDETYAMDETGEMNIGLGIAHRPIEIINGAILIQDEDSQGVSVSANQAVSLAMKAGLTSVTSLRTTMYNGRKAWIVTGAKVTGGRVNIYIDALTGVLLLD